MISDKKIVAIGGGTGLSVLLGGLKESFKNITAIVTVADDGGSSGKLRKDFGMLPPGDIRNCLCALANSDLKEVMNYRFTKGELKGHPFGNLAIAAVNEMSDSFVDAVKKMNHLLDTDGLVIPVTNENVKLCAYLENGDIVWGESNIGKRIGKEKIDHVELRPRKPAAVKEARKKIENADVIIFGPGSLYTSIIPNLLVEGITESIKNSKAIKIYVCNIMTQPGETIDYCAYDHLKAIEKHTYDGIMDYMIANDEGVNDEILKRYESEGAQYVKAEPDLFKNSSTRIILGNLVSDNPELLRHDVDELIRIIKKCIK